MRVAMHVDGVTIRGNERQALLIAAGLVGRGHRVVVSCRGGGEVEGAMRGAGAGTTAVRPAGDADVWSAVRFARWLRAERPDAILLTSWKRVWIASAAARAAGVPRVLLRVGDVHPVDRGPAAAPRRLALRRLHTGVIANSRVVAEHMRSLVGPLPVHTIANGIAPTPVAAAPVRAGLGIPDDAPIAVAVGGAEAKKGFDRLVDAAAAADPRLHLLLVGGGRPDPVRRLHELVSAAGMEGRVHLLPWQEDVPALVAAADLFVLPSRSEGMSVAMLEAMMVGTPVLAAEVGGAWDALAAREGRRPAGWIVPAADPAGLAAGLRTVLAGVQRRDPEVAARVREARWRVGNWFEVDRMVAAYESVLVGPS
jgi:glycosyltransferase involved in cell wall biosynthesis